MENKDNNIEILIHSYLSNSITHSEKKDLFEWLKSNPENIAYFNQITDLWLSASVFKDNKDVDIEAAYQRVKARNKRTDSGIRKPAGKYILITWQRVAAILIPFILLSSLLVKYALIPDSINKATVTVFNVPYGSRSTVQLPDGSEVILNAGSKLVYDNGFAKSNRDLKLTGEGYFKVAKNKKIPFVVHAGKLNVRATGTEFNIKAYPEDKTVEAVLVEGSVEVKKESRGKGGKPLKLLPSQSIVYDKVSDNININVSLKSAKNDKDEEPVVSPVVTNVKIIKTEIDPVIFTTWKESTWKLYRKDLSDLAKELERKYDVNIEMESDRLRSIKFTGTLKDESLEQVLGAISIAFPIKYSVVGKKVIITENEDQMQFFNQYYHETDTN